MMKNFFQYSILALTPLFLVSCDRELEPETPEEIQVEWHWSNYQKSETLQLGNFSVPVQPKQSLEIMSNAAGSITLHTTKKSSVVEKDFLWAEMDKDKLSEDKIRIDISKRKRDLEKHKIETLERPEKLKEAQEELKKAQSQLAVMKRLQNSKQLKKRASEFLNGDITEITDKSIREQENAVELGIARLNALTEIDEILWKDADTIAQMDLEQTQDLYEESLKASTYTTPFSGELRIELDLIPDEIEYQVTSRQVMATLSDYSDIHASLDVGNVSWINLPPTSLKIQLSDSAQTELSYLRDEFIKDSRTKQSSKFYIFSIPLEQNKSLKRLVGTTMDATLSTQLDETCFIVPKLDISLYALGKTKSRDYPSIVADLWEGARVLAEGSNNIAIAYNPELGQ